MLAGLPLPEGTQVAVSYIRRANKEDLLAGVALDTSLAPEAFMAQMARGLGESGWKQVRLPPPSVGPLLFASTDSPPPELELAGTPFFTKRGPTLTLEYPTARPGRPTRAFFRAERGNVPPEALPPAETRGFFSTYSPCSLRPKALS